MWNEKRTEKHQRKGVNRENMLSVKGHERGREENSNVKYIGGQKVAWRERFLTGKRLEIITGDCCSSLSLEIDCR